MTHKLADGEINVSEFADELPQEVGRIVRLLKETSRVTQQEAERAEAFKYACVRRMHPFAQAQVDADPTARTLDFQVEHFLTAYNIPGLREVQDEIHDAESGVNMMRQALDLLQDHDTESDRLVMRSLVTLNELQLWALQRKRTKIYANATVPE